MGHQILSLLWPIYVYCVPANTIMYRKYFPNTAHHHLDQSNAKVGATPVTAIYFQYLTLRSVNQDFYSKQKERHSKAERVPFSAYTNF